MARQEKADARPSGTTPGTTDTRGPSVKKLTKKAVKDMKPAEEAYIVWDTETKGFGVRVNPASKASPDGKKVFIVKYRVGKGRAAAMRKPTIGTFGVFTVEQARDRAEKWLSEARLGHDPAQALKEASEAPSLDQMLDRYCEEHVDIHNRPGPANDIRRMLGRPKADDGTVTKGGGIIPATLLRKRAADVTRSDIADLHRKLKATRYRANRLLAALSKAFSLAVLQWRICSENPVKGIGRYQEDRRQRYLSPAELGRLTQAMAGHEDRQAVNAIKLAILTGARIGEVLSATWSQFDLTAGVWTKPGATTKQKTEHRAPLSPPAVALLQTITREAGTDYVFPGTGKTGHLTTIKKTWAALCQAAEIDGVRIHDLRHTFAATLASSGDSLLIIGALLGHTQPSTTARYAHLLDDPLRAATDRMGRLFEGLETGKTADVVSIKGS